MSRDGGVEPRAGAANVRRRSLLAIPRMDCPAEEHLVRMALDGVSGVERLECDLAARTVTVWHAGAPGEVVARLLPLALGARLSESHVLGPGDESARPAPVAAPGNEARALRIVLALNAAMFVVEAVSGWRAQSTGLLADALDMLADAVVYGVALYAVGRPSAMRRAARLGGWLEAALAASAFAEVARRALVGSDPEPPAMIGVSLLALAVNATTLGLVSRHRDAGAHMRASVIFSANDVLANLGVIAAGGLVALLGSRWPDLVIGAVIAAVVLQGALRILRLR